MNPVQPGVSDGKIDERLAALRALGVPVPEKESLDLDALVALLGLGRRRAAASSEMEAIRAANLLMDNDPHGADWIKFNKPASEGDGSGARGRVRERRSRVCHPCIQFRSSLISLTHQHDP
jgi:5-methyltetrahydrofolate--homocysteine methyltransferase